MSRRVGKLGFAVGPWVVLAETDGALFRVSGSVPGSGMFVGQIEYGKVACLRALVCFVLDSHLEDGGDVGEMLLDDDWRSRRRPRSNEWRPPCGS